MIDRSNHQSSGVPTYQALKDLNGINSLTLNCGQNIFACNLFSCKYCRRYILGPEGQAFRFLSFYCCCFFSYSQLVFLPFSVHVQWCFLKCKSDFSIFSQVSNFYAFYAVFHYLSKYYSQVGDLAGLDSFQQKRRYQTAVIYFPEHGKHQAL